MRKKKERRGGARVGVKRAAHRPLKYGEETEVIHVRVPKSRKSAVLEGIKIMLQTFITQKQKVLP